MSSAFDIVQKALNTLSEAENLTREQRCLVEAVERTVVEWHELNHKQRDCINLKTPPGVLLGVVDTEKLVSRVGDPSPVVHPWDYRPLSA